MCEGSIYVRHRVATNKEELVLRTIPDHGMKGFYPVRGSKLVCTVPGTKAIMNKVQLVHRAYAYNSGREAYERAKKWDGACDVEVILRGVGTRSGDAVQMPDGTIFFLMHIVDGTRIGIGREVKPPRDLEKDLALDQLRAEVPKDPDALTAEEKAEIDDHARDVARDSIVF